MIDYLQMARPYFDDGKLHIFNNYAFLLNSIRLWL